MTTLLLAALLVTPVPAYFDVSAAYAAAARPGKAEVSITFAPRDPDVKINERPAPRLTLEGDLLAVEAPPAPKGPAPAAGEGAYLDTALPVVFAVTPKAGVKGSHVVKGGVTYFYCSKRDGWCRKGTTPVEFAVALK